MSQSLDILFIYPATGWAPEAMRIAENDAPPMGLLYVAAAARRAGLNVAVVDLNHFPDGEDRLADVVVASKPRIIGLSVLTTASAAAKRLIQRLRRQFPWIVLVVGGIHATVLPLELLSAGCDYAVIGEGEATMVELARAVLSGTSAADVAGIAFLNRAGGAASTGNAGVSLSDTNRVVETPPRPVLHNLDALSFPARDLVPLVDYGQSGALLSSRGCPYRCPFCSSVLSQCHAYRRRTITAVMDEVDDVLGRHGISHLQFLDDNFTVNPGRALELADAIGKRGVVWSCQATIMELVDRLEVLDGLFAAGCREIYFGLETGNRDLLRKLKRIDLDEAMRVLMHAASLEGTSKNGADRLQTVVGFIVGHPEDDESTIEDTFEVALQLRKKGIDTMVSIMQPYPGSLVYANPQEYGVAIESRDFSQYLYPKANISTRNLARDAIQSLYARGLLRIIHTYRREDEAHSRRAIQ